MTAVSKQTLYDYFCSGGSASNSISTLEQELEDLIDTFYGTWTDYSSTSTIVGWSSYTTKQLNYKKDGTRVYVQFWLDGTSDSNAVNFTLPYTANTANYSQIVRIMDNGTYATGCITLGASSSTVSAYPAATGGTWTTSGNKRVLGEFWYEAA